MRRYLVVMVIAGLAHAQAALAAAALPSFGKLNGMSVPFVPNAGQWDPEAAFAAQTFAGAVFVTREGRLVYRLSGVRDDRLRKRTHTMPRSAHAQPDLERPAWVISETLLDRTGGSIAAAPAAIHPLPGYVTYAIGRDAPAHRSGLPTFQAVSLGQVYDGVGLELRAAGSNVEKIFTVAAGADPQSIRVRVDGASEIALGDDGALIVQTGNGKVTYTAPIAYQAGPRGERVGVDVRYAIDAARGTYGFAVGPYDRDRPLVIDPLLQSTYVGGTAPDEAYAMAIHPVSGEVYIAGRTQSSVFPKTTGAEHAAIGTGTDAFVTRLNAALTTRLQSTYFGGAGNDVAHAIAVHPASGEVYIAGATASGDLPDLAGAEQTTKSTGNDAFVARFDATLTSALQATYLGGTGEDIAHAITLHPVTGDVYVAGETTSPNDFPKVAGAEQPTLDGGIDAFVTRLNAALTVRIQSTYFGSSGEDKARALALHPATGEVYVAGHTNAPEGLPKIVGAAHVFCGTDFQGFITRMSPALTTIVQSTCLGGGNDDFVRALAVHPVSGRIYVSGTSNSTTFQRASGSEQTSAGLSFAGFVSMLNRELTKVLQSTFAGGAGDDSADAMAIHPVTGEVYITGFSDSTAFPKVTGGEQPTKGSGADAFVMRVTEDLLVRPQATYLGGTGTDLATALAIHPASGEIYVAGYTTAANFPRTAGAEQSAYAGGTGSDAFVSRFTLDLMAADVVPNVFSFAPKVGVPAGSFQLSDAALITGVAGSVPIGLVGDGEFAEYCISSTAVCNCNVQALGKAPSTIDNNQYACVRQRAPAAVPASAKVTLIAGGGAASFIVATGNDFGSLCSLDVDGNGQLDALSDGLLVIRAMFGLTGTAVTNNALGSFATRTTWMQIQEYLNGKCGTNFAP